jgi:hypothetical protein
MNEQCVNIVLFQALTLVVNTSIVNGVALAAIAARISEFGRTPFSALEQWQTSHPSGVRVQPRTPCASI